MPAMEALQFCIIARKCRGHGPLLRSHCVLTLCATAITLRKYVTTKC